MTCLGQSEGHCYKAPAAPDQVCNDCRKSAGTKQWWKLRALRKTLQAAAAARLTDINLALQGLAADVTLGAQDKWLRRLSR